MFHWNQANHLISLYFSYDEYESSAVTNYEYELENGRVIGLDLVAETCDYINYL